MKKISLILVVALLSATNFAVAHGDKPHSKKPEMVKKEQKEWGIAGDAKAVKRTIEVSMLDKMRFSPCFTKRFPTLHPRFRKNRQLH